MRILHTADWHLGRIFHGVSLVDDQAHALDQLVAVVEDRRPDVVVIAGDVYDRAVPPPDAVALLDDVLSRIVLGAGVPTLVIAGNHDSPERIGFAGRLLQAAGLHVVGRVAPPLTSVVLDDVDGPVRFHLLPYAETAWVRERFAAEPPPPGAGASTHVAGHGSAMSHLAARLRAAQQAANESRRVDGGPAERSVVVAHGSVAGAVEVESERPLYVGPTGSAEATAFAGFHYVALGHHHGPQDVGGDPRVRYPGSLLKYSFAEADQVKSVSLVDLDSRGAISVEHVPITPRRDVRIVEGRLAELLARPRAEGDEDYLRVVLTDDGPLLDPLGRLRERYPHVLSTDRARRPVDADRPALAVDPTRLSDEALFSAFYEEMTGVELDEEAVRAFLEVAAAVDGRAREATK